MIFRDIDSGKKHGIVKTLREQPEESDDKQGGKNKEGEIPITVSRIRTDEDFIDDVSRKRDSIELGAVSTFKLGISKLKNNILNKRTIHTSGPSRSWRMYIVGTIILLVLAGLGWLVYSAVNNGKSEIVRLKTELSADMKSVTQLRLAVQQGNIASAIQNAKDLKTNFDSTSEYLQQRLILPQGQSPQTDLQTMQALLAMTRHFSNGLIEYIGIYERVKTVSWIAPKNKPAEPTKYSLLEATNSFVRGLDEIRLGQQILDQFVPSTLPMELRDSLANLQQQVDQFVTQAEVVKTYAPIVLDFLGNTYPRTYAILLQNQDEMRATGGFIGSIVFVTFTEGQITKLDFKDVYQLDWKFPDSIPAPVELSDVSKDYTLHDSNYFPSFPKSAAEVLKFFDKEGIQTVDGVVALNQKMISEILDIIGPIEISGIAKKIDSSNLSLVLSLIIESKQNVQAPKSIMPDLVDAALKKMTSYGNPYRFITVLKNAVDDRNLVFFSPHDEWQRVFSQFRMDGAMAATGQKQDYLMINESNIGGNKSDRYIEQQATHKTLIDENGNTINTLTLTRQHTFGPKNEQALRDLASSLNIPMTDTLLSIMGKSQNKSLIRIYVPLGSILKGTKGIPLDIVRTYDEEGKTVFAFKLNVLPGDLTSAQIDYQLPWKITGGQYSFHIDKQIGDKPIPLSKQVQIDHPVLFDKSSLPIQVDRATSTLTLLKSIQQSFDFDVLWK